MATITITEGASSTPPDGTGVSVSTASDGAVTHVIFGWMDGSTFTPLGDTDGVPIYGDTTIVDASAASASVTHVADTATSTELIASNASRVGWSITNTSSAVLYIKFGSGATTTTSYTKRLAQYESAGQEGQLGLYTGAIYGIWATDPGAGGANCTEW